MSPSSTQPARHRVEVPAPRALPADERALVARLRAGDGTAFETVFGAYYEQLYRYVFSFVGTREDAEELVQDLFCAVWAKRAVLPVSGEGNTLRGYLYAAARNRAANRARHARVVGRSMPGEWDAAGAADDGDPKPGMSMPAPSVDAALIAAESRAAVRQALADLPARRREILLLRADHQLTCPEIAATLGLSVKTVEAHITRAFRTLRQSLAHLVAS
jgi:RNA polymerase sigma-70 factor (ECF subfamily)